MTMNEVLPRVFVGGLSDTDPAILKEQEIKTVLTVMDIQIQNKVSDISYFWVKMFDMPRENIKNEFPTFIKIISESILQGNILIHCQVGMSRSVTAIVCYMIAVLGFTVEQSLRIIRERRPWACPNHGFMDQLFELQQESSSEKWDCSKYKTTAEFHHNLIKEQQQLNSRVFASTEAALQEQIKRKKLSRESDSNVQQDQLANEESYFKCRKCRKILFSSKDLEAHQKGRSISAVYGSKGVDANTKECTSYFLNSDLEWLPKSYGVVGGKINCDKCAAKIGHFSWTATQCSCGTWITPAFQIHKSRIDKVTQYAARF